MRTISCTGWPEFKRDFFLELFGDGHFRRERYLFRGAGDADWRLATAFDRRFAAVPLPERLKLWDSLLAQWRAGCLEAGVAREVVDDDRALAALGQHHGLPTRLLDWSLSPYVAAFFAFRSHLLRGPDTIGSQVAVWALHLDNPVWRGGDGGVEVVTAPGGGNTRLQNQGGRFTLCRAATSSLEEYVERVAEGVALTRCLLPAACAAEALADLDAMGVTDHQLFPDLDGLADMATMRAALAARPGP
ncbi:FRG domain-containing protein [Spongisporangium articulatum]|uniref:FRG domain-containing protein n=1 Tax=Spongisporangium articulatum TaxID=3362603 RepID=A0ABW8AS39_9ACTN